MAIEQVRSRVQQELVSLQSEIATLMQAAVQVSTEALAEDQNEVVIAGERNLLSVSDFSSDMGHLRRAFDLFEQKTQLMRLLDVSSQAEGVRIYIGGESQIVPMQELSVVSSPYEVDGQIVGTLGVISPRRRRLRLSSGSIATAMAPCPLKSSKFGGAAYAPEPGSAFELSSTLLSTFPPRLGPVTAARPRRVPASASAPC
jgi:hypothetical protein